MKRLLWLLPLIASTSWGLQAGDITARARVYLKDQATAPNRQQFPETTLLQFVSDGQREANAFAWLMQSSTTVALVGGTTEYSMPVDFMFPARVTFNGQKITQTSYDAQDSNSLGWQNVNGGVVQQYYINNYLPTPQMGFIPAPTTASTGTVVIQYVQQTQEITSDSQVPFNGWVTMTPYHEALVDYTLCRAWQVLEETDLAQPFCDHWNMLIGAMRSGQNKMPDFNPGAAGRRNQ